MPQCWPVRLSPAPAQRGRPPGTRALLGFLISGWLTLAPGVSPAWAQPVPSTSGAPDTIAGLTAQIAVVRDQLSGLDDQMTAATEAFDAGRLRLGRAQAAADDAAQRVTRADRTVQDVVQKRRDLAASAYRAGGLNTLSAILGGDPGAALDRVGALDALARRAGAAETQERLARVDLTQARMDAQAALTSARAAFDDVATQKQIIETSAARQKGLLDGLIGKQADLERKAREEAAAAERARQQAAAAEAARIAQQAADQQVQLRQQSALVGQAATAFTGTPVTPPAPAPAPPPPVAGGGGAATAVAEAYKQLGKPYVWGAAGPDTFDCSGLTQWVWAKAGVQLPHYTGDQWNAGRHVTRDQLIPGDLVFFDASLDHVGVYIGNGQMIHAPHTGAVVRVENVWWNVFQGGIRPAG
ncbi:C40 family peptidase [Frankia sp. AgB1.9]|nr:C40 family peptidase [Frankia sp. AgW1.1]MBL7550224.1 C40 family peptidase [Frankia sp. AgB1.9]MBL7619885.1 C40 family peptidase [Frankia sp. AgB1.8]